MQSGTKSTDPFVIDSGFLLYLPNWQSGEVLQQSTWAESFVMLFVDASIDQVTERIGLIAGRIQ